MGTSHAHPAMWRRDGVNPDVLVQAKIAMEMAVLDLLEESHVCSTAQVN